MIEFKKLTEQLLKIYSNSKSVDDLNIENYFDENISLIGTGKHEIFENLNDFLESFQFDVKRRGQIKIEIRNLKQTEEWLNAEHVLAHGSVDFVGLFEDESICFKMNTRFTIVYKWTGEKWLVQHLHQSVADQEQMDGEEFPLSLGKQVKEAHQALNALSTAYYHVSSLDLKTKKIELVKRSRKIDMDIQGNVADWDTQFEVIKGIIASKYGCRLQGATDVAFTVLDVLGYLDEIPVCVAYDIDGEITTDFPTTAKLEKAKPVIEKLPGWKCDIRGIKKYEDLPENCRKYVEFVEEHIGFPITMISNGPGRDDIIYRNK